MSATAKTVADAALIAAKVFEAMDWRWAPPTDDSPFYVPDAEKIAEHISRFVEHLRDNPDTRAISGGRIRVDRDGESDDIAIYVEVGYLG